MNDFEIINTLLDDKLPLINNLTDAVWDKAETAFTEKESAQLFCHILEKEGFTVERGTGGISTAFSGVFGSGSPVIGILGEFDALSGLNQRAGTTEKVPVDSSQAGRPGHGCGHNLLGGGSLAAVIGIKKYLENCIKQGKKNTGTVIYYGCPGEEGGSGKSFMARSGVFNILDIALTWHPSDFYGIVEGSSLANYQLRYRFQGVSAHAAGCPHLGRSALDALELMNIGINFLREHVIPEARLHYSITDTGGYSPNVVQASAEGIYLLRAPELDQVADIYRRVCKIAEGAALMTETHTEHIFMKACANVIPNAILGDVLYGQMEKIPIPQPDAEEIGFALAIKKSIENSDDKLSQKLRLVPEKIRQKFIQKKDESIRSFLLPYVHDEAVAAGSTDVGDVSWICPTAQINTATWAAMTPGHSWQVVSQGKSSYAHKATLYAGKVLACTAIACLKNPEIIRHAKEELAERLCGKKYKCPIPDDIEPVPLI
jgi:aminobenzoyl-glutamate utilization protein B